MSDTPDASPDEEVLDFACEGEWLMGVLHPPAAHAPRRAFGVLIVVGGPQYRAGSHRQFVHLARQLAAAGYPVLRFDVRGMGDSSGDAMNFEQLSPDIAAALDAYGARMPSITGFVLWGLCDGASAALLYVDERADRRVLGLCLANPWVRSTDSHARTTLRHYYMRRLLQGDFWRKLLRGKVAPRALRELGANAKAARQRTVTAGPRRPFHQRMQRGLAAFEGPVLVLLSGQDYTAREFADRAKAEQGWRQALARQSVSQVELVGADHTFSDDAARQAAEERTLDWLATLTTRP